MTASELAQIGRTLAGSPSLIGKTHTCEIRGIVQLRVTEGWRVSDVSG